MKLPFSFNKKNLNYRPRFNFNRPINVQLIAIVIVLCILGLVIISSATKSYETMDYVKRQGLATVIGLVLMILLMIFDFRFWKKLYIPIYLIGILLLILTLLFGHGEESWGARSWLQIGPINFQPAELVKIALIISFATVLENNKEQLNRPLVLLKVLVFAAIPIGLIMLQPDFGTAMVFIFFIAVMLFFADIDWKYVLAAIFIGIASLPFIYFSLDEYQKNRILDFINPNTDLSGSGYQANEGRIAIGSGRLFGRGLYKGAQTQYNFIPTKETDYIFPVLVEELGFIGGGLLLILYFAMLRRMFQIARLSKDTTGKLITVGLASVFLIHIWENIGMTLGLMPLTGIPLPFMSYGGSFQLVNLISIGLILSVQYHRKDSKINNDPNTFNKWFIDKYYDLLDWHDEKRQERLERTRRRRNYRKE